MWTKRDILSKVSWKILKSVHHVLVIIICLFIFFKILGFYLEFLKFIFPKATNFIVIAFAIPLVFFSKLNIDPENVAKHWRFSPSAVHVIISIHFYSTLIGWFLLVSLILITYQNIVEWSLETVVQFLRSIGIYPFKLLKSVFS